MMNIFQRVGWWFVWWLLSKGGEDIMYATFLAHRVIGGKLDYSKVPTSLREEVKTILTEEGAAHLIDEAK